MTINNREHWQTRYANQAPETMSWFESEPAASLALLERGGLGERSEVIDVGSGASTLAERLLARGVQRITVLDIAGSALAAARVRLGDLSGSITWREADVLTFAFAPGTYDLWHDRAVFHFLTESGDRARYVAQLSRALRPGGGLVMGTFAEDGPARCSGLDVVRYAPFALSAELGPGFELCDSLREVHRTPTGATQSFLFTRWTRTSK